MQKMLLIVPLLCMGISVGGGELPANKDSLTAKCIVKYYKSIGIKVHVEVVEATIKAIDGYLPKYFPGGPFTRQDFLALAMTESRFHQYEVGSSGEQGIFQIMAMHIPKKVENPFGIRTNTWLAMMVLQDKYKTHNDYKKAIIAYNGVVVRRKTKTWCDRYWKSFQTKKIILQELAIQ